MDGLKMSPNNHKYIKNKNNGIMFFKLIFVLMMTYLEKQLHNSYLFVHLF